MNEIENVIAVANREINGGQDGNWGKFLQELNSKAQEVIKSDDFDEIADEMPSVAHNLYNSNADYEQLKSFGRFIDKLDELSTAENY